MKLSLQFPQDLFLGKILLAWAAFFAAAREMLEQAAARRGR
ncbi:hypothetical protein [Exilibacterium tricleocarpae]|nr:hypothetical protein [Exilibacterium tricleocarpae]